MQVQFQENGYFKSTIDPRQLSTNTDSDVAIIRQNFDTLTKDPYSTPESNRFRAYSNLVIVPWERKLMWAPLETRDGRFVSSYWQGGFNPEHPDAARHFTPITQAAKETSLLNNLILHDFDLTFWKNETLLPIYVGVHFVKLLVLDKAQTAYSSPDLLHRDGEAFTFAHLFNRFNIKGGVNTIAGPEWANQKVEDVQAENMFTTFELRRPFESYGVCDGLVSHYVSPITMADHHLSYGCREIILIDFSPLQQRLA